MKFERPRPNVEKAMERGDTEALSRMGKRGAQAAQAARRRASERAEMHDLIDAVAAEKRALEDAEMRRAANEHIITPDGEDVSEDT